MHFKCQKGQKCLYKIHLKFVFYININLKMNNFIKIYIFHIYITDTIVK